jgi:hypothetical protein
MIVDIVREEELAREKPVETGDASPWPGREGDPGERGQHERIALDLHWILAMAGPVTLSQVHQEALERGHGLR